MEQFVVKLKQAESRQLHPQLTTLLPGIAMGSPVQLWTAMGCRSCARAKALLGSCGRDWETVDVASARAPYASQITMVPAVVLSEAGVILSGIDAIEVR